MGRTQLHDEVRGRPRRRITLETRYYAHGTSVTVAYPVGPFVRARALCPDGKVRATVRLSHTPDTFYSIPAAVQVCCDGKRRTVSGFITVSDDSPATVEFVPNASGRNANAFSPVE